MKIGLTYDLKEDMPRSESQPEDALEEYDSRETIEAIAAVLERAGHSVVKLGGGRGFLSRILQDNVAFVFNIAEGRGNSPSREAQVPAVLEMLNIPYSGSDPQCLAICLDKPLTKKLVATAGIRTPRWQVISDSRQPEEIAWENFPFPVFLKPAHEGSSKGIRLDSRIDKASQINQAIQTLLAHYQQPIMVEEFIAGEEVTVGVVGNSPPKILGIMRIRPKQKEAYFIYSLEVKRDWERLVDYECPTQLAPHILQEIAESSLQVFEVLGCRDFARIDFRLDSAGQPYFMEINPLPGLKPDCSDLVIIANKMGLTYPALISAILKVALERYPQCDQR